MHKQFFMILIVLTLVCVPAFAHGDEEHVNPLDGMPDPLFILGISSMISIGAVAYSLINRKMKNFEKSVVFTIIVIPIIIATVYLAGHTVYLNVVSESGGPIHWHADYEVWICGERLELVKPDGFDNKIGTAVLHDHGDNRIHVEGVVVDFNDVDMGNFFRSVGGEFTKDKISFITSSIKLLNMKNGDLCDEEPGKLYMFVNGKLNEEMDSYIPSPYETIPPGDEIKIVFSEKNFVDINGKLGEDP